MSLSPQGDTVTPTTVATMNRRNKWLVLGGDMENLNVSYTAGGVCMDTAALQNNLTGPQKRKQSYSVHPQVQCEKSFKKSHSWYVHLKKLKRVWMGLACLSIERWSKQLWVIEWKSQCQGGILLKLLDREDSETPPKKKTIQAIATIMDWPP